MSLESASIRRQFPILTRLIDGSSLAYLDNAATTQKPQVVLDRLRHFYEEENANINRGMHPLAEAATVAYEKARKTVARFIGASDRGLSRFRKAGFTHVEPAAAWTGSDRRG